MLTAADQLLMINKVRFQLSACSFLLTWKLEQHPQFGHTDPEFDDDIEDVSRSRIASRGKIEQCALRCCESLPGQLASSEGPT